MNQPYTIRIKTFIFWKKYKIIGHSYDSNQNKLVLFFENGGIKEIPNWNKCSLELGIDWVLAKKKQMELEAQQSIPLKIQGV